MGIKLLILSTNFQTKSKLVRAKRIIKIGKIAANGKKKAANPIKVPKPSKTPSGIVITGKTKSKPQHQHSY